MRELSCSLGLADLDLNLRMLCSVYSPLSFSSTSAPRWGEGSLANRTYFTSREAEFDCVMQEKHASSREAGVETCLAQARCLVPTHLSQPDDLGDRRLKSGLLINSWFWHGLGQSPLPGSSRQDLIPSCVALSKCLKFSESQLQNKNVV